MPKYGRRKHVREKRALQRHFAMINRTRPPEQNISIEIMTLAFARFRASDEWQIIGWWGRWASLWRDIGWHLNPRVGVISSISSLAYIYKRHYSQNLYRAPAFAPWVPRSDDS